MLLLSDPAGSAEARRVPRGCVGDPASGGFGLRGVGFSVEGRGSRFEDSGFSRVLGVLLVQPLTQSLNAKALDANLGL